jgi:rubredoxin---NAD+ reductase
MTTEKNNAPVVIVGSGLAGWSVARELRQLDATLPIALISATNGDFYAKPGLSTALAQAKTPEQLVTTPAGAMAEKLKVQLHAYQRVIQIDTTSQSIELQAVELANAEPACPRRLQYRDLILATGAEPIRVPLHGNAVSQAQSINSLEDYTVFRAGLKPGAQVLIMGAGLIGCEFANDLSLAGYAVSLVDPGQRALAALLPEAASEHLQQSLNALGVQFHWGLTLQKLEQNGARLTAQLSDGNSLEVDQVISAIGLRADTCLAQSAGIVCERGVVVDAQLQTSAEHVYALGDAAQYASLSLGGSVARGLPYVMPIMNAVKVLAKNLARPLPPTSADSTDPTSTSANSSAQTDAAKAALIFPLMPVAIKTPALPLVVASPAPGTPGQWAEVEPLAWQWVDDKAQVRGFVLAGPQTSKRMAFSKLVVL